MIDKNLVLHLPFDDPDGDLAYDYSQSRADAKLSNCIFTKDAKNGKALFLNGDGEAVTDKNIPFESNFTLTCYIAPGTKKIGWLLNLPGVDNYLEQWIDVVPGEWCFFAFVRSDNTFTVYKNQTQIYSEVLKGTPKGFSINDSVIDGTKAKVDEVRLYDVAKSAKDIFLLQKETDVEYYIDGVNFKDFGVYVSGSSGLVGRLARKDSLQVEWDSYHGITRDKRRPRYRERKIELECFIEASSRSAYVEWVNLFFSQFDKEGNHRLKVEYAGSTKPLVYEVELLEEVDPTKQFGRYHDDLMVGQFKIKLVEDEPVKMVLRHIGVVQNTMAVISITSTKLINIYWGDGEHTYNVSGEKKVKHIYESPGEYDIIVTGVIEDIESFSTNAIVVWKILK